LIVAEDGAAHSVGPREWLLVAAVLVAVGVAYGPAWNGGFLWDDAAHLTRPELRRRWWRSRSGGFPCRERSSPRSGSAAARCNNRS
jgi:hypothetical protein